MRTKIIILFLTLAGIQAAGRDAARGLAPLNSRHTDTLLDRYRQYLIRTEPLPEKTRLHTLNAQGQWADINYQNTDLAGWKILQHLLRVREMALAWANPESPVYGDPGLLEKLGIALDHWLKERYQSDNWWHNEIGVPRHMRDIILLLRHELSPARLEQSLEVMAQFRIREGFVGANLVWIADIGMHYGALSGNEALIRRCRNWMLDEIKITTGEGIQPDHSFHQHGKRLQMYQYGRAFLVESIRIAWQCRGTAWAFPDEKISLLADFTLNGWQWMARGNYTVPGTMDRSASRKGELTSADLRALLPFIMELQPGKSGAFREMLAIQNGRGSLKGFRYYPYSDFAVFHRPGFSFFLKTISARTLATESINNENLKGKLLHSGDAYLIRNGKEYTDLLPLWDWTALPGVTMSEGAHQVGRQSFVGSVGNGTAGLSAMDYVLRDSVEQKTLSARKLWACYQDAVICLIADLDAKNAYTALDQCRWQGDVTVNGKVLKAGQQEVRRVKWMHHAGFAYIPLQPAAFSIRLEETRGNWTSINASETEETVEAPLFTPLMLHEQPRDGYALALCETPAQAEALARKPAWEVLQNDGDCQAVRFDDGTLMAAFYAPAKLETGKRSYLQVDKPCLILLKDGKIYASDPNHAGGPLRLSLDGQALTLALPEDGTTAER